MEADVSIHLSHETNALPSSKVAKKNTNLALSFIRLALIGRESNDNQ